MGELYNILKAANFSGSGDDGSAYAHSLELTINSQTYVLTATLKNTSGEALGTSQTIDLPLETMVVGGSYDDTTKKVILTLKNGNTVDFSVADLVSGLQSEITSTNKLNSDLVDDTNQNNKFVTSAEKTAWTAKQSALTSAQLTAVNSGIDSSKVSQIEKNKDALVELVDSGTKNFLKNEGTTTSTATVNSDGTIIINGTNTSAVNITLSSTTKLPAGDYVLSTENTGSSVYLTVRVANDIQYTCTGNTKSISFTLNEETTLERVYLFINANTSIDNLKLKPMICSKAAWDISQKYVPYRPSYDKLSNCKTIWEGTQSEYEALVSKNYDLYMIYEEENQNGD